MYAVKLSQYDGESQSMMGQNDPKITQGLNTSQMNVESFVQMHQIMY